MKKQMQDVAEFYDKVLHIELKNAAPARLTRARKRFAIRAMGEELREYEEANTLSGEVDALLDLLYFLVGRLLEHGISSKVFSMLWTDLQKVNMAKEARKTRRGRVDAKRRKGAAHTDFGWLVRLGAMGPFITAAKVSAKKQKDYGLFKKYFPFGEKSAVQMLHLKVQRLINLLNRQGRPSNESKRQNVIDLMNYTAAYYELLGGRK